ncbi:MAG: hypothetical protein ACRCYP_01710 [Alphaproteobacteria bacterium]
MTSIKISQNSKRKSNKLRNAAIALSICGALTFAAPRAEAFSFPGVLSFLSNVIGIDIAPLQGILSTIEDFTTAISKGDFGAMFDIALGVIGDFGLVNNQQGLDKARQKVASSNLLNSSNFGPALQGEIFGTEEDFTQSVGTSYAYASTSEEAQKDLKSRQEATAENVDNLKKMAEDCAKKTNSLSVLRCIPPGQAAQAGLMGQHISVDRSNGVKLDRVNATLNNILTEQYKTNRRNRFSSNQSVAGSITASGGFAGLLKGK